jgi:Ca-activated chloride channel family protein
VQTQLGDARVFAVGVDTAVNSGFLKRLASLGGGTCTLVTPGDALDEALRSVGREIGTPLVTGLKVEGAEELAPANMPDLFAGRAATVFFRCAKGAKVRVRGTTADGSKFDVNVTAKETKLPAIAHLWARTRVSELEDQFRMNSSSTVKQEIIRLAVAHTLLTKFTAFVVVDESEIVNKTGDVKKVVQPVHEPAEWARQEQQAAPSAPMEMDECVVEAEAMSKDFGQTSKSKLDDVFGDSGAAYSAPPPPPPPPAPCKPAPAPMGSVGSPVPPPASRAPSPPPAQAPSKPGFIGKILGAFGKGGAKEEAKKGPAKRKASGPPPEFAEVEKALDALKKAFAAAHAEVKAGRVPEADALEKARKELMLALTSEIGQRLGLLQRFLRSALMEIVAAVGTPGVTAAQLAPMFDQHAKALDAAAAEMKQASGDAAFWESTV